MFFRRSTKMQVMKKRLLLLISVFIFASLILYRSFNSSPWNGRSLLRLILQSNVDEERLVELLRKISMPDRTVVLTVLDEAWARPASVLQLFLESFQVGVGTKRFLNHLLILTTDHQAYQYCKAMHPHCFPLPTRKPAPPGKPSMHPDRSKFDRRTIRLLREVNDLGYNFLFTDADVMWLKNPFLHVDPTVEMTTASKVYTGDPKDSNNHPDGGFFFVKSNDAAVEFLKCWEVATVIYPDSDAQSVLEKMKEDEIVPIRVGQRIKYLDTAHFSSICEPNKDMRQVHTMHASCCEDLESKVHDLRLVLDDWRMSSINASSWSVPRKCRR